MKYNTEIFINKASHIHNNKYDYLKVNYINYTSKVIVICKIHGEFEISPMSHIKNKNGCKKCANKQLSINEFIIQSKKIHNDLYDYSKTIYINQSTKITIKCFIHGDFELLPNMHLKGSGCKMCSFNTIKLTNNEFIKKAINIHKDKYDYSKTNYINTNTKVIIICKIHGEFMQKPNNHINLFHGCVKCSNNNIKLTNDEFIKRAINLHGNKYDYSKINYVDNKTKVEIICKIHGIFKQLPSTHYLMGNGCFKCSLISSSNKQKSNKEEFIKKAIDIHKNKYDYSNVIYTGCFNKIIIKCAIHGEFIQTPTKHLSGHGCVVCNNSKRNDIFRSNNDEFIKKAINIHNNLYDYSKVNYVNNKKKILIICKIHGEFSQSPSGHINKRSGCPYCYTKTEGILMDKLSKIYPSLKSQLRVEWCKNINCLPFDFYIDEYKIIIELDGGQHFKQVQNWEKIEKLQLKDIYKIKCANLNYYSVIRLLQEDVYNDKYDWIIEIQLNIKKILEDKIVQNIFMCKSNEYDKHIKLLNEYNENMKMINI